MSGRNLDRLFAPESIAIVGASANPAAIGGQPIAFLQQQGFAGRVYPVNPKYEEVAGLRCYSSLADVPEAPDVVVVAVSAALAPEAIAAAGKVGARFAIVFSAGFAEAGPEGAQKQKELAELARKSGVTLIGPNCQGMMNISVPIHLGFGAPYGLRYRKGGFAFTSQSGAFGNSVVMDLDGRGVGLARYISTGNEGDLDTVECLEAFLGMEDVTALGAYVEGLADQEGFRQLARRARAAGKPVILWKVGTSPAGARAALAHTANLHPETDFAADAFREEGVIAARDARDIAICLAALWSCPKPAGNRVGIVTLSGGAGIAAADRCHEAGLDVSSLARTTLDRMKPHLPSFASLQNPVDVTGSAVNDPDSLAAALTAVAEDPGVDALILALAAAAGRAAKIAAEEIVRLRDEQEKPVLVCWNGPREMSEEAWAIFEAAGVHIFASPGDAVRGLEALCIAAGIAEPNGAG